VLNLKFGSKSVVQFPESRKTEIHQNSIIWFCLRFISNELYTVLILYILYIYNIIYYVRNKVIWTLDKIKFLSKPKN